MYKRSSFVNRNSLIKYQKNQIRSVDSVEVKLGHKFITNHLKNDVYSKIKSAWYQVQI